MTPESQIMPIETLSPGQAATIVDIHGDDKTIHRLAEMGIQNGSRITMKKNGEPLIMSVEGHDVLLRCSQAVMILVAIGFVTPVA